MANGNFKLGKRNLLSSTALTKQVAAFSALGLVFGASSAYALDAGALPEGGNVVGGAATISQAGSTMNIKQTTNRTVIDWRSFNIGSKAAVDFAQPGASSIAVNRVNSSANPTQIQGSLHANGQVWILNPNGVLFGKTARVDVAGIVASTGNINKDAFMRGDNRLHFTGPDGGEVSNAGLISVADGGLAAFVAPSVRNSGVIRARVGKVTLAAGTTFTLDLAGDDLVELGLGADHALVDQSGELLAAGSIVNLTTKAAGAVVDSVINVSGTVLASGITEKGGKIILTADNITTGPDAVLAADGGTNGDGGTIYAYANNTGNYDGTFSARGGSASGDGGSIETSGKKVQIASGISVDTRAVNGETGNWTIDPDDLVIGGAGADVDTATIVAAMDNTGMTLTANNSITVNEEINSSTQANTNTLALNDENADDNLTINLNDKIILGANQHLTGQGTTVNVADGASIQNGVDVAATGADVNVAAGDYDAGTKITKNGITLAGADGAKINVGLGEQGVNINANDVTLTGFEIAGPVVGDQATLDWNTAGNSWGVFVTGKSNSNVTISNNNIHDVRTGILIANSGANGSQDTTLTDAASGTIADNLIENTKGAILVQYRDGHTFDISGNLDGANGNEWGIVTGLQNTKIESDPSLARQQQILDWANTNNGMTVMDRQYATGNRSEVTVDATGTATAADDFGLGNGVGNERQPINNIGEGANAVVVGGTVNVNAGTYSDAVVIDKGLTLQGTDADDRAEITGGITLSGSINDVSLKNLLVKYDSAPSGKFIIRAQGTIDGFSMDNVIVDGQDNAGLHGVGGSSIIGDISITNSVLKNIGNWVAFDNSSGGSGRVVTSFTFSNNLVDNVHGGITVRQIDGGTGSITITGNTVQNIGDTANATGGIFKIFNAGTVDFANNTISDVGENGSVSSDGVNYGAALLMKGVDTLNVTDNSFTNVHMAVAVEKGKAAPTQTTFTDNTFDNTGYAFFMPGDAIDGGTVTFGTGNEINSGIDTVQDIVWRNSNALDLTNVKFNGKLGSEMTDAELFALEDLITHGTDLASSGLATVKAGNAYVTQASGSIQNAVDKVSVGDTVNVDAGTYNDALNIVKNVDIVGAGSDLTFIKPDVLLSTGVTHKYTGNMQAVVFVNGASDVNISGVTIDGNGLNSDALVFWNNASGSINDSVIQNARPFSGVQSGQGIAVDGTSGTVDLTVSGVTFLNWNKNAIDVINGNGGSVDGSDVTLNVMGSTFTGRGATDTNAQNGVVLWERAGGTINATIGGSFFSDLGYTGADYAAGVLQYGSQNGMVSVKDSTFTNVQAALALAGDATSGYSTNELDATDGNSFDGVSLADATLDQIYAIEDKIVDGLDDGLNGIVRLIADNVYVTATSGSDTIQNAVNKVVAGDTINVAAGTYDAFGISFGGASDLTIQTTDGAIIDGTGLTGRIVDLRADGTTFSGFTINGDGTGVGVSVSGQGVTVSGNTINNTLTGVQTTTQYPAGNATISGNVINTAYGISLQNSGNNVTGNDVTASTEGVGLLTGDNTFTGNTFDIAASGTALALYDTASAGDLTVSDNNVTIAGGGLQGAIDLAGTGGDLTVNGGTYNEDVVVGSARNISFVGATIDKFTTNVATAIGGTVSAVNGFFLNGLTTLLSNTVLNGAVTAGSVDGTGHSFTVNNGATVLNGNSYKASSLTFNGSSTQLTQASTSFDTSAAGGDITFTGPIVGTADGAQAIVLNAGPGTAAGANGDISLQNVGSNALWLGDMTVTGDDFSAATVYVNNFTATLMGNQTFTSTTLHTRGDVNSNVGGDATGPIDSQGDVNVNAGGDFSGDVSGSTMNISAQNIDGSFTGGSTSLNATNNVNATTNVTDLTVNSPSGTVNGTYTSFDATGGPIVVNGKTQTGDAATNPNQIIVEGFTLPAGAIVTSSGEIILPDGMLVGLVSPAAGPGAEGGKAKVVIVHNVQMLGQLLAEGYVAIIVDLSKNDDDIQEVAMN